MSTNLVEPFFSTPTDPKEYMHSFSDSLINFSPPPPSSGTQEHLSTSSSSTMGETVMSGHHHHHHHHHLGTHHMLGSHSSLSDIFKCVEEDQYDVDFHNQHHTLCSPCLIDGKWLVLKYDSHSITVKPNQITTLTWNRPAGRTSRPTSGRQQRWQSGSATGHVRMRFRTSRWPTCCTIRCPALTCVRCSESTSPPSVRSTATSSSTRCSSWCTSTDPRAATATVTTATAWTATACTAVRRPCWHKRWSPPVSSTWTAVATVVLRILTRRTKPTRRWHWTDTARRRPWSRAVIWAITSSSSRTITITITISRTSSTTTSRWTFSRACPALMRCHRVHFSLTHSLLTSTIVPATLVVSYAVHCVHRSLSLLFFHGHRLCVLSRKSHQLVAHLLSLSLSLSLLLFLLQCQTLTGKVPAAI